MQTIKMEHNMLPEHTANVEWIDKYGNSDRGVFDASTLEFIPYPVNQEDAVWSIPASSVVYWTYIDLENIDDEEE